MLHRLVYLSSLVGSPDRLDLDGLLRAAREKNGAEDITGILLYHDGNFLQALEGPRENVLACYDRIQADRRHKGCVTLQSEEVESRMFSEWQMACVPYTDLSPAHREGFLDLMQFRDTDVRQAIGGEAKTNLFVKQFLASFRDIAA